MFEIRDEQYAELRRQVFTEKLVERFQKANQKAVHDPVTNNILVTDARGNTARLGFDQQGFIGTITSPLGRRWCLENDNEGKLLSLTNPAGSCLRFDYNEEGDVAQVFRDNKPLFYFDYVTKSYLKTITFPDSTQTQFQYTDFLKISKITDRRNKTEIYDYSDENDLIAIKDGNNNKTHFDYSIWDRPDTVHYANGSTESYQYNPAGLLQRITSGVETVADIIYNDANQPTEIHYGDGNSLYFNYDKQGHITEARNNEITIRYVYDTAGKLIEEHQGDQIVKYHYDKVNNLTGLTYPSGETIEFAYDPDSRLAFVKDWQGKLHRFIYADKEEGIRQFHPNALITTTYQSKHGLPTLIEVKDEQTDSELFSLRYQYDDEDRVTTFEDSEFGSRQYEYDAENQLLAVKSDHPQRVETYTYDGVGNRTRFNGEPVICNSLNQVIQQSYIHCDYDVRDNLTMISLPGKQWWYTFNKQNQLIRAKSGTGVVVTFGYDAFGRRIWKRSGTQEVRYIWMGETLLSQVTYQDGTQIHCQDYLYKPNTYTPLATRINGEIYSYHTDHLGTPRRLTNAQGKIVWASDYSAFGYAFITVNEVSNHLRFPGQYFDTETGLHYNRFRYYLPVLGRYISRDPLTYFAGFNFYSYVSNSPINAIDPLGLWWKIAASIVAAVAVGVAVVLAAPVVAGAAAATAVGMAVTTVVAGAAAGAVGYGVHEALTQEKFCAKCILAAMGKGALVGTVASLPFAALPFMPAVATGVLGFTGAGAVSGGLGYSTDWAATPGAEWNWGHFALSVGLGAGTAGLARYALPKLAGWWRGRRFPSSWPEPTEKTDAAARAVIQAMDDANVGKSKQRMIVAVEHEDGSVTVGISGDGDEVGNILERIEFPTQNADGTPIRPAPREVDTSNFIPAEKPSSTGGTHTITESTCAEPKVFNGSNQPGRKVVGMTAEWRGNPRPNRPRSEILSERARTKPEEYPFDSIPCEHCEANKGDILSGEW